MAAATLPAAFCYWLDPRDEVGAEDATLEDCVVAATAGTDDEAEAGDTVAVCEDAVTDPDPRCGVEAGAIEAMDEMPLICIDLLSALR
ncbi:MAG: hypothetical protein ACLQMO_01710 [Acidobacteriaceae bacterium]